MNDNEDQGYQHAAKALAVIALDFLDELTSFEFLPPVTCDSPWDEIVESLKKDPRESAVALLEWMKRLDLCS